MFEDSHTAIKGNHSGCKKSDYKLNANYCIFRQNNNSSKQDQQTSSLEKQKENSRENLNLTTWFNVADEDISMGIIFHTRTLHNTGWKAECRWDEECKHSVESAMYFFCLLLRSLCGSMALNILYERLFGSRLVTITSAYITTFNVF